MAMIHPTAIVDPKAQISEGTIIGPYCVIGPNVIIGKDNNLLSHVIVDGVTQIGNGNRISQFAVIGTHPQDLKYAGEPTSVKIGDNNTIREFVTINCSNSLTESTVVGSNNLIMAYAHIAHNCQIGSYDIIANAVNMAGHIIVQDNVSIGGMVAIHQFVHIGTHAFVGGASAVKKDVPPYTRGQGNPYEIVGLNSVGLMRKGFSSETIAGIKEIYKLFYHSKLNTTQAMEVAVKMENLSPEQKLFIEFVKESERGISKK
ncbi:MAG TPA: acyl-ACP--UDP-N-acetylglucosamine O-acyltransferase [Candidatus Cloacimonadota bacterium]|nr:acyl-ACP--UDP-N-acetylglucosamine O-acyltransferase [Candidatus Cloacimonadota bacterium]